MASQTPESMSALAISKFCTPDDYTITTLPTPKIAQPDEVLIKVHSASINPGELKLANGVAKLMFKNVRFPWILGYDVAGTVVAVGNSVTSLRPGDEVYSKLPERYKGTVAQFALGSEASIAKKPQSLNCSQAASVPLAAVTALLTLEKGASQLKGGLKGKTILIPGGLSGTGHFAVQLAKNVFGCAKVITTLSTSKVHQFESLLGHDYHVVDYTKERLADVIPKGSVDFVFDTMGGALEALPLMKKGGSIISISTMVPSGTALRKAGFEPSLFIVLLLNLFDWIITTWSRLHGVNYNCFYPESNNAVLDKLREYIDEGKVVPIVGTIVDFSDLEGVKEGCQRVFSGKGGIGKFVIDVNTQRRLS